MLKHQQRPRSPKGQTAQMMSFAIGHLTLGLPLDGITKVIPKPPVIKGSQAYIGLAKAGEQDVLVLDVEDYILGQGQTPLKGYLILFQANDKTYGIPCVALPAMRDMNPDEIQPIPEDYRQKDALGIASRMVTLPTKNDSMETIFLLSPQELLERLTADDGAPDS
ncbi:MAG: hypothetical protein HC810_04385 [Acaryochloridaceae cyanobacterium RL_2_7]|nr:hypothetical protein [Acaryochloridaceae cyanobacterium RL_2_7]